MAHDGNTVIISGIQEQKREIHWPITCHTEMEANKNKKRANFCTPSLYANFTLFLSLQLLCIICFGQQKNKKNKKKRKRKKEGEEEEEEEKATSVMSESKSLIQTNRKD